MDVEKLTVAERLDIVRKQKGLTYNDLSILIENSNANALGTAFRRNTIKTAYVFKLIEKLNLNDNWVFNGEGDCFRKIEKTTNIEDDYETLKAKYEELQKLYVEVSLELKRKK